MISSMYTRRDVLRSLASAGALGVSACGRGMENDRQRPNILVIYTDDQNFRDLGCYGGSVSTPHADGLARAGMRFTRYFASAPVCTASRYNLLTGRYASRSQALQQEYPPSDNAFIRWNADFVQGDYTIAQVLKRHGYVTGMVGKWHNGMGEWEGNHLAELERIAPDADPEDPVIHARLQANYEKARNRVREYAGFDYAESLYCTNIPWIPLPKAM